MGGRTGNSEWAIFQFLLTTVLVSVIKARQTPTLTYNRFGYVVEFGGAMSNVCTDTDMSSDYEGDGGWPCFPSKLHGWLADVAGPEGWKYLLQPPAKLVLCLLFLAFNVGMLAVLVAVVRDPECLYESRRHREERKQRKKCERCAETGLRELDEIKND
ncbi:hypothetical protein E2P81_ATG10529 [Venturia nashicola]|nr:hypothetical protein E2P81_ATG10529 [Venturia nashicola]